MPAPGDHQAQMTAFGRELAVPRLADVHEDPMPAALPVHGLGLPGESAFVRFPLVKGIEFAVGDLEDGPPDGVAALGANRRESAVSVGDREVQAPLREVRYELELRARCDLGEAVRLDVRVVGEVEQ